MGKAAAVGFLLLPLASAVACTAGETAETTLAVETTPSVEPTLAATTTTAPAVSAPPASRAEKNPGDSTQNHWIGRNKMTSKSIEVVWSEVEDVQTYRIHRFGEGSPGPADVLLDEVSLVFEGLATTFVDEAVEEGQFYTYVLEVRTGAETLDRRWTKGLAMDDTVPPSPITNLRAEIVGEGVLLSWDPSSDNVEFAAYSVSIVEGDQLRYIGGGADIGQSSFLDNRPLPGDVTYAVQAADFHDNRTEPALITISR